MTIPELDFHSTDDLIRPYQFYPAEIHVSHHQLRNFISTASEDKVFFVHNFDIFVLDLRKHQCSLLATIPFEARCLAANHGWICVGGETKGDCAFVKIGEGDPQFGEFGYDLIVDMLGKEIVNSMTIHRIPGAKAGQPDDIVVLISNNDKTVTLYSLSQREILCVLPHPVPMNYASMSPDSTIIAAVGDSNEVYFYRRQDADNGDEKGDTQSTYPEYDWKSFAVPKIPAGEGVWDDFSFAVAFSPSGQFCAVSAQGGAISVFDMQQLAGAKNNAEAEHAITCTFRSSRASLWGCVRSLAFSPEPWDLLAWTEDHGTIGVADIRRAFVRRQCMSLNKEATQVVEIENTTSKEYRNMDVKERLKYQYMQRVRALRGHPPVGARSLDETHHQQAEQVLAHNETVDVDVREQSVLNALAYTIDEIENFSPLPYSVNYTSAPTIRPSAISSEQPREADVALLDPGANSQGPHTLRRRQSVVLSESTASRQLSPPENNRTLMTASPAPMSEDNSTPPMSTNDLTPSHNTSSQPMPYNIPPSDPWHVIEAQLIADRAAERRLRESGSSFLQIEAAIHEERQLSTRLERYRDDERRLSALLRTELTARNRPVEPLHRESDSERTRETRLSPSLERALQRQFQIEQEGGLRRAGQIANAARLNTHRMENLFAEREALLRRARDVQDGTTSDVVSFHAASTDSSPADDERLDAALRQMEEEREACQQHLQDLELQVRRAESRVEIATAPETSRERIERMADTRLFAAAARPSHTAASLRRAQQMDQYGVPFGSRATPSTPGAYTSRARAATAARRAEAAIIDARSTLPRTSELAGRVSESDMRLARSMLQAAVMDANGNWIAGHGIRRHQGLFARPSSGSILPNRTAALEDILRDSGVGTAGIGWSPDGSFLYAGSEVGIFEYKVNLRDRMQFPSLQVR